MKFEKFLKGVGTHGEVINVRGSQKWLVCNGVGMLIPKGVDNLLGVVKNSDYSDIIHELIDYTPDDILELKKAVLLVPTGNSKDILRVFESQFGNEIGILNENYGLLEKEDILSYDVIITVEKDLKMMLVFNFENELIGYITGTI